MAWIAGALALGCFAIAAKMAVDITLPFGYPFSYVVMGAVALTMAVLG